MTTAAIPGAAEAAARTFAGRSHGAFIDGDFHPLPNDDRLPVENPATEEVIAEVPSAGRDAVDLGVRAAARAFAEGRWTHLQPAEQEAVLRRLAALVTEHGEELAWIEVLDNGKTLREARGDVAATAAVLSYYAGWPTKLSGEVHSTDRRFLAFSVAEPVGVCGQIVPWNYPLLMASWKLGPALAAGNTIVLKPAEQTPLAALLLAELCAEAGVPSGVVQVVTGDARTGAAIVEHPDVHKIGFTGSTEVGRVVMGSAAATLKRVTLELGGKNPNVVFADADLEAAVQGALEGAFENCGQACIAGSRLLVERRSYEEVVERLRERADAMRVAPGWEEDVDVGPLVSAEQRDRVIGYVDGARSQAARVVTADPHIDGAGHFMRPTVVADVAADMTIFREEVFGPVVTVTPFDSEAEAVALANDTRYGLSAGVWTADVKRAIRAAREIRAGTVWVNAYGSIRPEVPFGGFGESGLGRELGAHALGSYTELKSVFLST